VTEPQILSESEVQRQLYLSPAEFIDSDHPSIRSKARAVVGSLTDPVAQARALYNVVRDEIRYDPYIDFTDQEIYRASSVLAAGHAYCVGKASLYIALCRAVGIPARLGLADVKNHLATPRLLEAVGTDIFAYHGYVEIMIGDQWIKATPTFNVTLCQKLGVAPLEFDGQHDALMQPFDANGREFMSYVAQHGTFFDVPAKFLMTEMARIYPKLCVPGGTCVQLNAGFGAVAPAACVYLSGITPPSSHAVDVMISGGVAGPRPPAPRPCAPAPAGGC